MTLPKVAQYKPYYINVEKGESYLWCSCGLSKTQPFCDTSHVGTDFKPVRYVAEQSRKVLFCGCKHTNNGPFCDGSHNNLTDEYAEDERPLEELLAAVEEVLPNENGRAGLDGNCYVQKPQSLQWENWDSLRVAPVITAGDGAKFIGQYRAELQGATSSVMCFQKSDVVLYTISGEGDVHIGSEHFTVSANTGVYIKRGEAFAVEARSDAPLEFLMTVCPGDGVVTFTEQMPDNFDSNLPERVAGIDPAQRNTMADRFYQILVGQSMGSDEVTQFIGEIPRSKAAPHRHLYEEAILILSGSGTMWTDTCRTPVAPGDIIFLPAEQEHSLQCTDAGGMTLAGHFYPSGSPNINY